MRSAQEIAQYEQEFAAFQAELGDLYYDSPTNRQIFTQAMLDLQIQQNLTVWELWQRRIFASVFVSIFSRLEKRPPKKSRAEREAELEARDRRATLPPSHETRRETEQREERERLAELQRREFEKQKAKNAEEAEKVAEALLADQEKNPGKYAPQFVDRDLTPDEMWALPAPNGKATVLRWWLQKRREFLAAEAQQKERDRFAARALKNLVQ